MARYLDMYCYFIRATEHDFVKIGYTTNVEARLVNLQTGCPYDLEIMHVLRGAESTELFFHKKFAKSHVRGEWFRLSGEIERYVCCLKMGYPGDWLENFRLSCLTLSMRLLILSFAVFVTGLYPQGDVALLVFAVFIGSMFWNEIDIDYGVPNRIDVKVIE